MKTLFIFAETAIINAIVRQFGTATNILSCIQHLKGSVERHLTKNKRGKRDCPANIKNRVKRMVVEGPGSLTSCCSRHEFNEKKHQFLNGRYAEYFTETYLKQIFKKIEDRVISPREKNDTLPKNFYNNNNESMNAVIKVRSFFITMDHI